MFGLDEVSLGAAEGENCDLAMAYCGGILVRNAS